MSRRCNSQYKFVGVVDLHFASASRMEERTHLENESTLRSVFRLAVVLIMMSLIARCLHWLALYFLT